MKGNEKANPSLSLNLEMRTLVHPPNGVKPESHPKKERMGLVKNENHLKKLISGKKTCQNKREIHLSL